ncbi:MAG: hypothetical protein AB1529_08060 [Candidatus Micrarchaeota archaeon]
MRRIILLALIIAGLVHPACEIPTDDFLVNASTTFCSGTYNISDAGAQGIIIANANNIDITCNGTILVGGVAEPASTLRPGTERASQGAR